EALREPAADTDKNEAVSALEAFRYASQKTKEFFETQKRLETEHSVIEDTGKGTGERTATAENGQGKLAAAFCVVRLGANAAAPRRAGRLSDANEMYKALEKQNKKYANDPDFKVAWALVYLDNAQPEDAGGLFAEALKIKPDHAWALLGMAMVAEEHFEARAV